MLKEKVNIVSKPRSGFRLAPLLHAKLPTMTQRIDNRTRGASRPPAPPPSRPSALRPKPSPSRPASMWSRPPSATCRTCRSAALNVLAAADAVLAEDTRVTKTLLAHYGITTPLVAYHEHSNDAVRDRMVHRIREGQAWPWSRMPARRSCPIPATSSCRRRSRKAFRSRRSPAPPPCSPRSSPRACRPTASSSKASCRRRAPRAARGWRRSALSPAR